MPKRSALWLFAGGCRELSCCLWRKIIINEHAICLTRHRNCHLRSAARGLRTLSNARGAFTWTEDWALNRRVLRRIRSTPPLIRF